MPSMNSSYQHLDIGSRYQRMTVQLYAQSDCYDSVQIRLSACSTYLAFYVLARRSLRFVVR